MNNSIVIEKLDTLQVEEIKSAIIIMDGTELYDNPVYTTAKTQFNQDQNCEKFVSVVKPLYVELGQMYGLEMN